MIGDKTGVIDTKDESKFEKYGSNIEGGLVKCKTVASTPPPHTGIK